ncbi:hypothetical protein NST23_20910 [Brevibacillus sp. FSL K6-0770]|nr:hypothetical protein [Brevibacillus parabrevis]
MTVIQMEIGEAATAAVTTAAAAVIAEAETAAEAAVETDAFATPRCMLQ